MDEEFMPIRMSFRRPFPDVLYRTILIIVFVVCVFTVVRLWRRNFLPQPASDATQRLSRHPREAVGSNGEFRMDLEKKTK